MALQSLCRFTKDSGRFKDELEIMKYICKDFWTAVYKKQIDNLRTNHQVINVNVNFAYIGDIFNSQIALSTRGITLNKCYHSM